MNLQKVPIKRSISCYFCHDLFEEQFLQFHINQCAQVLEPCQYKCGVYVPRKSREKHAHDCIEKRRRHRLSSHVTFERMSNTLPSPTTSSSLNSTSQNSTLSRTPPNLKTPPKEALDYNFTEMKITNQQSFRNINNEILRLHRLYNDTITQCREFDSAMNTLKLVQNDIIQKSYDEKIKVKLEFEKIQLKNEITDELIKQLKHSIDKLTQNILDENKTQANINLKLSHVEQHISLLEHLETELIKLNKEFKQDRKFHDTQFASLKDDFLGFKEYLNRENVMLTGIWNEQLQELHKFKTDLSHIDDKLKGIGLKQQANIFEIKTNSQISHENDEKIVLIQQEMVKLQQMFIQLHHNYEDLINSSNAHNCSLISNTNGHIIWKISPYSEKLQDAIENNTVFRSPIFLSNNFGYKLQMVVYLNGLGKWKGRNLIMTMHVLKGEWDSLLEWPCNLSTTVILKDQNFNKTQSLDIVKHLTSRQKLESLVNADITETSTQHIFIPHKILKENNYTKNDSIYFDIKLSGNK